MNKDIDALYKKHEGLIHSVIRKNYPHLFKSGMYDDAVQEGSIALLKAIKGFDKNLGYSFSTYAYPIIKHEIYKHLYRMDSNLRVSRNSHETYTKYRILSSEGYSFDEIVSKLNTTIPTLLNIINAYNGDYLERPVLNSENDNNSMFLDNFISSNEDTIEKLEKDFELKTSILLCKSFLTNQDYQIFVCYCNKVKQEDIGKLVGVTQVTVSRHLTEMKESVFPQFKQYILGELPYGRLCLKLLKYSKNVKNNISGYINYIFELISRGIYENDFFNEIEDVLNWAGYKTMKKLVAYLYDDIKLNKNEINDLENIMGIIDEHFSTEGIEEVVYDIVSVISSKESKNYVNDFKKQLEQAI